MKVRWGRIVGLLAVLVLLCGVATLVFVLAVGMPEAGDLESTVEWWPTPARQPTAGGGSGAEPPPTSRPAEASIPDSSGLPAFRVMTLQYTPYMATLVHMAAGGYMTEEGYDLQLFDVYGEIDLDEDGQCEALRSGEYDALATTLDATRKCGQGVALAIPIGQSAGNDAIVVKGGVETWNDVFEHAIAFTGNSVSHYLACFASHSANQPMHLPLSYDDAHEAVVAWANAGAEIDIQSVVAWEPEVEYALQAVPGSRVILSSDDVRILWDVVEFSTLRVSEDPAPFQAFTRAYYAALKDLSRDPAEALGKMVDWAAGDEDRQLLLTATSTAERDVFLSELDNEAFATLRDAAILMEERQTTLNRLEEAGFYWNYCGVDVPPVDDLATLVLPEFVTEARQDESLLASPGMAPGTKVFQVTDFTNASAVTDADIEQAQILFQTGVDIEFVPNRTDFLDPEAANRTLQDAVRFLRTCVDCVLEVQGGAAYPGERVCPGCEPEDSDELAVERGRRVYDELRLRFDVPQAQLVFVEKPHAPSYPGSNLEEELRQDRRTFLTGYQLSGR